MSNRIPFLRGRRGPLIALALLAVAFVALVALTSWLRGARLDLTENRQFTLSQGTVNILGRIQEPVRLRLYYSEKAARNLPQFRVFAQRVQELLQEVASRSHGKVLFEVVDPEPFSEAEDQATRYGLQALPLGNDGDKLYFGLVGTNSTDGETTMPFIHPDKENFLEYDLAKLISSLAVDKKPVLAVLSDLPTGPGADPVTGRPTMGWVFDRQLSQLFEMRRLQPNPTSIADDVDLLMLIHPKRLTDDSLYAIDQFVLRGGRLLVFVDPDAESDPAGNLLDPTQAEEGRGSNLEKLFKAWGVEYDPGKVVLDPQNALQVQPDPDAPPVRHLAILGLRKVNLNQHDVVTADLDSLNFSSAGALALDPASTLKLEALVQSSSTAAFSDPVTVREAANTPEVLADAFKADATAPFVLAARLSGPLKTAFPERGGDKHLAASKGPVNLIVVADTDLLSDRLWVQAQDFLGQQVLNPFAGNGDFVYNAVDNLIGNSDLITVRTRATANRPFMRVDAMRRAAEQRYQAKERQLQQQLDELEQKLSRLQPEDGKTLALTRQQQAELQQFQEQKLQTRRELRDVQHQLNARIETLGKRLKLLNILVVPALLALLALFVAWRRRLSQHEAED